MNSQDKCIGRAPIALVSGEKGFLSFISSRLSHETQPGLTIKGPGTVNQKDWNKIQSILVPLLDTVRTRYGKPPISFEFFLDTTHANTLQGIGMQMTGLSASVAMAISLISTAFRISVRQDVLCIGQLASINGDIAMVESLQAKLEMARHDETISTVLLPSLENDQSIAAILNEKHNKQIQETIASYQGILKIIHVNHLFEAIPHVFAEYDVVLSSLNNFYFDVEERS